MEILAQRRLRAYLLGQASGNVLKIPNRLSQYMVEAVITLIEDYFHEVSATSLTLAERAKRSTVVPLDVYVAMTVKPALGEICNKLSRVIEPGESEMDGPSTSELIMI